jgi:CDP-glycerol glycerophosphotransferase (TagB/SpsB family)
MHAAPLYEIIGGTVITVSQEVRKKIIEKYHVKCMAVDDVKINNISTFDSHELSKTFDFLNKKAKVVVFYDLIDLDGQLKDSSIFLQHGVSVGKAEAFWENGRRLDYVKQMIIVSSVDRYNRTIMVRTGVPEDRLIDITIARTTELIQKTRLFKSLNTSRARKKLGLHGRRKIIAYMPSYWSKTSVTSTGLNLVKNISDKYTIIFWPHPQTTPDVLNQYDRIAEERSNVVIGQKVAGIDIMDVYSAADFFFSDPPTSVISDMILAHKPIVFCRGKGDDGYGNNEESDVLHGALQSVVSTSLSLDYPTSLREDIIDEVCRRVYKIGFDKKIYDNFINGVFYNTTGSAAVRTAQCVLRLMRGKS